MAEPSPSSTHDPDIDAFRAAVQSGDTRAASELLGRNPNVVAVIDEPFMGFDSPAIVSAASQGNIPLIDALVAAGANVDVRTSWWAGGFAAIDVADATTADHLLALGATLTIHAAAGLGRVDNLGAMLAVDASRANERGGDGMTPLHTASTTEICALLLEHGAEIDARDVDHNATPAQYAINEAAKLRFLVDRGAEPDIYIAAKLGDVELTKRVLALSPDAVDSRIGEGQFTAPGDHIYTYKLGGTARPLTLAAAGGSSETLSLMLEAASPSSKLHYACATGDRTLAGELMSENPDLLGQLSGRDKAAIGDAAWDNNIDAIQLMLEIGFDIEARSVHESTPLDRAAIRGNAEIVKLLLARGASVDVRNAFGGTPLRAALWGSVNMPGGDHAECVRALLAAGSDDPGDVGTDQLQAIVRRHFGR
ncbi:MAG TPA: ankyrin repeat domain-containing protein [Capsulimonadaceae bacterium]|jgi:ankyrin repeat protein